jgi:hypothetical protein
MGIGQKATEGIPKHVTGGYAIYPGYQGADGQSFQAHQRGGE